MLGRTRMVRHSDCSGHDPVTPQLVIAAHFNVNRIREGYDQDEVDNFLDYVAASLAGYAPPLSPDSVRNHEFTHMVKRGGFDPEEVDDFLECIAQTLEGRSG